VERLQADRDAWRRRAEAAEKDLLYLMNCDYGRCFETTEEAAAEWNRRAPSREDKQQ